MRILAVVLVGVLSLAAFGAVRWLGAPEGEALAPVSAPGPVDPAPESPAPRRAEPVAPGGAVPAAAQPIALLLPTGERIPGLNGVDASVQLLWPEHRPYSPIVRKRTDPDGLDWYVHEDGSQSTTQMVYRSDLGRKVAMSVVAHPHEVAPLGVGDQPKPGAKGPAR